LPATVPLIFIHTNITDNFVAVDFMSNTYQKTYPVAMTGKGWTKFLAAIVQWPAKKISHHLNVSVKKALITHLDFDVTQK
jgi:hypothetical protein